MSQAWEAEENSLHHKRIFIGRNNHNVQRLHLQEIPSVTIKQAVVQIGRYCECGCGLKIPSNAKKNRRFYKPTCRRNYANQLHGYSESKNIIRARLRIKKPILLTLYPGNGDVIKVKIPKECKTLLQVCDKLEKERKK